MNIDFQTPDYTCSMSITLNVESLLLSLRSISIGRLQILFSKKSIKCFESSSNPNHIVRLDKHACMIAMTVSTDCHAKVQSEKKLSPIEMCIRIVDCENRKKIIEDK